MNCHVIAAPSMVAMFENFVSVTQEEDVPQVSKRSIVFSRAVLMALLLYQNFDTSASNREVLEVAT